MFGKLHFRLRSLLILTLLVCLALWSVPRVYRWYHSVPLAQVLAECNQPIPFDQEGIITYPSPNVTEEEVLGVLHEYVTDPKVPAESRAVLKSVLHSRRLPGGSTLDPYFCVVNSSMRVDVRLHVAMSRDEFIFIPIREFAPTPERLRSAFPLHHYDTTLLNDTHLFSQ
ncbi:hypothetical protein [Aeoliella sp.]|uniref:hypothetical protein n=1 Tax=Aeoliella sp. TaxID=2795800 RepID=UPI003CCBF20D